MSDSSEFTLTAGEPAISRESMQRCRRRVRPDRSIFRRSPRCYLHNRTIRQTGRSVTPRSAKFPRHVSRVERNHRVRNATDNDNDHEDTNFSSRIIITFIFYFIFLFSSSWVQLNATRTESRRQSPKAETFTPVNVL